LEKNMDSNSISNGEGLGNEDYYDRKQQQEQFDERQKVETQKVELQQQQVQLQREQQDTNQKLLIGGSIFAGLVILAVLVFIAIRISKRKK
jgi:hypothetical protein